MFLTKHYHPHQPVNIKLYDYDGHTVKEKVISVRDSFPSVDGVTPMYAAPNKHASPDEK